MSGSRRPVRCSAGVRQPRAARATRATRAARAERDRRFLVPDLRRIGSIVTLAASLAGCAAGCGSGGATVAGRVTLDGRPLPTGSVQFHPQAGGPIAYGSIGPEGGFSLRQGASNGPIPPGRYTATVVALSSPASDADESQGESLPAAITPPRYGDVSTSNLVYDLAPGSNTLEIELSGGPPDQH
jgi:hypothetical protein